MQGIGGLALGAAVAETNVAVRPLGFFHVQGHLKQRSLSFLWHTPLPTNYQQK